MTQFEIGSAVSCCDGPCGSLTQLVVNPMTRSVTHLIVEPAHRWGLGRLVPIALVSAASGTVSLPCTLAQFNELELAEESQFLSSPGTDWGVEEQVMVWPYYALDPGDTALLRDYGTNAPPFVITDKLPPGEVAVRRGDRLHATDGEVGLVKGLIIDPRDDRISHVLVQEGHLLGRKEIAIPIAHVDSVKDGIHLNITKDEIRGLPPVGTLPSL